jgi:hypothetical protein
MIHSMEMPEVVPMFLHYPHNYDFSLTFYKEKAYQYPGCNNTSYKAELRRQNVNTFDALTPRLGSVDLSRAYSGAVIVVPCFC